MCVFVYCNIPVCAYWLYILQALYGRTDTINIDTVIKYSLTDIDTQIQVVLLAVNGSLQQKATGHKMDVWIYSDDFHLQNSQMKSVTIRQLGARGAQKTQLNIFVNNEERCCSCASKMQESCDWLELLMGAAAGKWGQCGLARAGVH